MEQFEPTVDAARSQAFEIAQNNLSIWYIVNLLYRVSFSGLNPWARTSEAEYSFLKKDGRS